MLLFYYIFVNLIPIQHHSIKNEVRAQPVRKALVASGTSVTLSYALGQKMKRWAWLHIDTYGAQGMLTSASRKQSAVFV